MPEVTASTTLELAERLGLAFVRGYHRLSIEGEVHAPPGPVLFVANHGFGGFFDLNVLSVRAVFDAMGLDRPVTTLAHQMAWTLGLGPIAEAMGCRPGSRAAALDGFARGHHVLVYPGGDLDAFKAFGDRHQVVFDGRAGFARLAMEAGVPIVPIVTAGAGDSLYVVSDGRRIARALRLDKVMRLKAVPVSVSFPWGLSAGLAGVLPYLPLPAKVSVRVLPAMSPVEGESADDFATRVHEDMQKCLTELAGSNRPWSR